MKHALFLLCIMLPLFALSNEIDNLKTNADVVRFLVKKFDKDYKGLSLFCGDKDQDKLQFGNNKFYKLDIDGNGLTDLIVDGYLVFAVAAEKDGSYSASFLDGNQSVHGRSYLISVDSTAPVSIIVAGFIKSEDHQHHTVVMGYDTLIYKFGGFVERRSNILTGFHFDKLTFSTGACLGKCAVFEMEINDNKTAEYNAIKDNYIEGKFNTIIPQVDFDNLAGLLEFINPMDLDSSYKVNYTDFPTAFTTIYFNGKSIKIRDYGEEGTYGLQTLYKILFSWRKKLEWEQE